MGSGNQPLLSGMDPMRQPGEMNSQYEGFIFSTLIYLSIYLADAFIQSHLQLRHITAHAYKWTVEGNRFSQCLWKSLGFELKILLFLAQNHNLWDNIVHSITLSFWGALIPYV